MHKEEVKSESESNSNSITRVAISFECEEDTPRDLANQTQETDENQSYGNSNGLPHDRSQLRSERIEFSEDDQDSDQTPVTKSQNIFWSFFKGKVFCCFNSLENNSEHRNSF